jgi:SMI1 / KNR4 family (SUKH-1)
MYYDSVRNAVEALRQRDAAFELFGAGHHRYELNPGLSEAEVAAFEGRYGVQLPEAYRHFLLSIGDGGAGPSYGIFKLGRWMTVTGKANGRRVCSWVLSGIAGRTAKRGTCRRKP